MSTVGRAESRRQKAGSRKQACLLPPAYCLLRNDLLGQIAWLQRAHQLASQALCAVELARSEFWVDRPIAMIENLRLAADRLEGARAALGVVQILGGAR